MSCSTASDGGHQSRQDKSNLDISPSAPTTGGPDRAPDAQNRSPPLLTTIVPYDRYWQQHHCAWLRSTGDSPRVWLRSIATTFQNRTAGPPTYAPERKRVYDIARRSPTPSPIFR